MVKLREESACKNGFNVGVAFTLIALMCFDHPKTHTHVAPLVCVFGRWNVYKS